MKNFALGSSTVLFLLLTTSLGVAQNAPLVATNPAEGQPAPTSSTPPNSNAPSPGPAPAPAFNAPANPAPTPWQYPYPYPAYGYPAWAPPEPPKEMPYTGGPIPYGYKLEEKRSLGLMVAGATLFGLSYALSAYSANIRPGVGSGSGFEMAPWDALYIPVTGPFAFSAYAPGGTAFIFILEGVAQVAGLGMFFGGLLLPKSVLVRNELPTAYRPTLHIGPGQVRLEMHF